MARNASEVLIDMLQEWGIDTIFGLPGDGINGIMEALRQKQDKVRFIHVRHEEAAAFMACAWAKFTGRLGCCLATSGPGGRMVLVVSMKARASEGANDSMAGPSIIAIMSSTPCTSGCRRRITPSLHCAFFGPDRRKPK